MRPPRSSNSPSPTASNAGWFKSSFSTAACTCVEVCVSDGQVGIRDSKQSGRTCTQPVITVPMDTWHQFLVEVSSGPATGKNSDLTAASRPDGMVTLHHRPSGIALEFNIDEWSAFLAGVANHEFAAPSAA